MSKLGKVLRKGLVLGMTGTLLFGSVMSTSAAGLRDVLDASVYTRYQDLNAAFGTNEEALYNHYVTFGLSEGRTMNDLIDVKKYREAYPDLDAAFGDDWDAYVEHYLTYGFNEGRNAFGTFNARVYADRYPDLKEVFGYDVLALYKHYMQFGRSENRNAAPYVAPKASTTAGVTEEDMNQAVTVSGRIIDPETGAPVPYAVVRVTPEGETRTIAPVATSFLSNLMVDEDEADASVSGGDSTETPDASVSDGDSTEEPDENVPSVDVDPFTTVTDENGNYSLSVLPGTYSLTATADGYMVLTMDTLIVNAGESSVAPTITLLSTSADGVSRIGGRLTNALNGEPIAEATVELRNSWGNFDGAVVTTVTTDANGEYTIDAERGYYTATYIKDGFVTKSQNVISFVNTTSNVQNEALTPEMVSADSYRIVLTWGETPHDLDSHITGPSNVEGEQFHVAFFEKGYYNEEGELVVSLDFDDVSSFGPETVTVITPEDNAVYRYSVHNFSGEAALSTSGASVAVYSGNTLVATYNVPVEGEGNIWNVFEIRDGQIVTMNTFAEGSSSSDAYFSEDLFTE